MTMEKKGSVPVTPTTPSRDLVAESGIKKCPHCGGIYLSAHGQCPHCSASKSKS